MPTIWKYELSIEERQIIEMPKGAEILSLQSQNNQPCIWARCEPDGEIEVRHFEICTTGGGCPDPDAQYIGTFLVHDGRFVGHVFETTK